MRRWAWGGKLSAESSLPSFGTGAVGALDCSGVEGGCPNRTRANLQAIDVHPPATSDGPSGAVYVLSKFTFGPVQTYIFPPWKAAHFHPRSCAPTAP